MKRFLKIALCFVAIFPTFALPTDSVFLQIPNKIIPTINRNARFELAEYFKAGKTDSIKNSFGTFVSLEKYDTATCHIRIKTSPVSRLEIKRIQRESTNLFVVINTILKPVMASNIAFYNTNWDEITVPLEYPSPLSWINTEALIQKGYTTEYLNKITTKNNFVFSIDAQNRLAITPNFKYLLTTETEQSMNPYILHETKYIQLQ